MKKSITLTLSALCLCLHIFCSPFNPSGPNSAVEQIRSNLYVRQGNAAPVLLDGDLTQYDASFSNAIDGKDARKMSNFSENLGMIRGTNILVIERRQTITSTDTIFYKLWQMQQRTYQLEFVTVGLDHPGMQGFLEDNFLKTSSPINLNGTTTADFDITADPNSADVYRFRIVFKSIAAGALPLTFTSIKAYGQNNYTRLDWVTENETNMKGYNVERSVDGTHFTGVADIRANNSPRNNYTWLDMNSADACRFYRVMIISIDGKEKYSPTVKISNGNASLGIKIFPNPIVNNKIHFEIENQSLGTYAIRLLNNFGQPVFSSNINHSGGNMVQDIQLIRNPVKGVYQLEVTAPNNVKYLQKIVN